jgi:hypothetical protein
VVGLRNRSFFAKWVVQYSYYQQNEEKRGYVNSASLDLKSSNVNESEEKSHSCAACNFSLNKVLSTSELTFWKSLSSRKSRDR